MSYDILLIPLPAGVDPEKYLEQRDDAAEGGESGPPSSEAEARKRALAERLKASSSAALEEFVFDHKEIAAHLNVSEAEARNQWRHIELNSPDGGAGVQIELEDNSASLALPYWHAGQRAAQVWGEVWSYLEILQNDGGYAVYDPQLGRLLSLASDRPVVLSKYLEGIEFTKQVARDAVNDNLKPWWKLW